MAAPRPDPAVPQPPALATGAGGVLTGNQLRAMLEHLSSYWRRGQTCPDDEWERVRDHILETVR